MNMMLPPADAYEMPSFPKGDFGASDLIGVTEVCERSMWAMYDAMRGAFTGQQKTAPSRRRAGSK